MWSLIFWSLKISKKIAKKILNRDLWPVANDIRFDDLLRGEISAPLHFYFSTISNATLS